MILVLQKNSHFLFRFEIKVSILVLRRPADVVPKRDYAMRMDENTDFKFGRQTDHGKYYHTDKKLTLWMAWPVSDDQLLNFITHLNLQNSGKYAFHI